MLCEWRDGKCRLCPVAQTKTSGQATARLIVLYFFHRKKSVFGTSIRYPVDCPTHRSFTLLFSRVISTGEFSGFTTAVRPAPAVFPGRRSVTVYVTGV